MPRFLIDVNLPYYFGLWNTEDYIHQIDLGPAAKDQDIWMYAKANGLTIITKDSDFSAKVLLYGPPPKVIHIRIGNVTMSQFFEIMHAAWPDVLTLSASHRLVNVYADQIEAID